MEMRPLPFLLIRGDEAPQERHPRGSVAQAIIPALRRDDFFEIGSCKSGYK